MPMAERLYFVGYVSLHCPIFQERFSHILPDCPRRLDADGEFHERISGA